MIDAGKRLQELVGKGNEVVLPVFAATGLIDCGSKRRQKIKQRPIERAVTRALCVLLRMKPV